MLETQENGFMLPILPFGHGMRKIVAIGSEGAERGC